MIEKEFLENCLRGTDKDILLVRYNGNACIIFRYDDNIEAIIFDGDVILGNLNRYLIIMSDNETRFLYDNNYNLLSSEETDGFSLDYLLKNVFISDDIFLCEM